MGVSTLVTVPHIRTSRYVAGLAEAIPALCSFGPGEIEVEELPALRNFVVVNDVDDSSAFEKVVDHVPCAVDFRELFIWKEKGFEDGVIKRFRETMDVNDVINLQFTRYVLVCLTNAHTAIDLPPV